MASFDPQHSHPHYHNGKSWIKFESHQCICTRSYWLFALGWINIDLIKKWHFWINCYEISVIPGRLLASAYPASRNRSEHLHMTEQFIINSSVQVIVNLMEKNELTSFTPYEELMQEYANKGNILIDEDDFILFWLVCCCYWSSVNRSLEFISFPLRDGHVNEDHQQVLDFCLNLCQRLKQGQILLIHCW